MGEVMIYNYDNSGEYTRSSELEYDPVEHQPLVPALATMIEPPEQVDGFAAVFADEQWSLVADTRGIYFSTSTGDEVRHDELGVLPAELTALKPNSPRHRWDGSKWIISPNALIRTEIAELEQSIDTSRIRREVFEGMRKKLEGRSPAAGELWAIDKVQDVDNQIAVLRSGLT